jgi:hypothetical protein
MSSKKVTKSNRNYKSKTSKSKTSKNAIANATSIINTSMNYDTKTYTDITNKISKFIIEELQESVKKNKLIESMAFIRENNFKLIYKDNRSPCIYLIDNDEIDKIDEIDEIGRFEISDFVSRGSKDMSISVEDNYKSKNLQGKGLARLLITSMIYILKTSEKYKTLTRSDTILAIDTDASGGFWDNIGMKPNPYYAPHGHNLRNKRIIPYSGFEKIIKLGNLSKWAIGYNIFSSYRKTSSKGGSKRKTKRNKLNNLY